MRRILLTAAMALLVFCALAHPALAAPMPGTVNTQPVLLNAGYTAYSLDRALAGQYNPITLTEYGKLVLTVEGSSLNSGWLESLYITKPKPDYTVVVGTTKTTENTSKRVYTMTVTTYLEPGDYMVYAGHRTNWSSSEYKLKAAFTKMSFDEQQPNETSDQAQPLTLPASIRGVITPNDVDYFQFDLEMSRKVEISLKQYDQYFTFGVYSLAADDMIYFVNAKERKMPKATTLKKTLSLPEGKYYIMVEHGLGYSYGPNDEYYQQQYGRYNLKAKVVGAPKYSLVTLKKARVSLGLGDYAALPVAITPSTLNMPKNLQWNSSKPSVAMVDASTGAIRPLTSGKTIITVSDGFKKASCTLTVGLNQFKRKKPLSRKSSGVYSSTSSLRYENGELVMDIFMYNKTKYKLYGADYTYVALDSYFDLDDEDDPTTIFQVMLNRWEPQKGVLGSGKYEVYTYRIPLTGANSIYANLDLGSGGYEAYMYSMNYELTKKSSRVRVVPLATWTQGAEEDSAAMPG